MRHFAYDHLASGALHARRMEEVEEGKGDC